MSIEEVCSIGYLAKPNQDEKHVLISIKNPAIGNARDGFVQVAVTIESAITLRAELDAFLTQHGVVSH